MNTEYVVLVNEQDEVLGTEEKITAHKLGLLHRAFSIFVYRYTGNVIEFLLQQRHQNKYHCGGLWTNTCCSHPRLGEDIISAGRRRLKEEMSIDIPLKQLRSFNYHINFDNGLSEHELDHVLIGKHDPSQVVILNPDEAQAFRWISREQLLEELCLHANSYTPWFKPALNIVLEDLCINS
jgi:isopentenyl-diphosphate delta-isomerase type 1